MQITSLSKVQSGVLNAKLSVLLTKVGIEIHNIAVFHKNGRTWFKMPNYPIDDGGEKKWIPVIEFKDPNHEKRFQEKLRELYNAEINNSKSQCW